MFLQISDMLMTSMCSTCFEEENEWICHWTGELSEDAETPETEDSKSKEAEGELVGLVSQVCVWVFVFLHFRFFHFFFS